MESSTGVNSINCDTGSPLKHCIDLVNTLAAKGLSFSISVKIENSFVFQLQSKDAAKAPKANKRSPSYKRRQEKRRLLRKKSDTFREKPVSMNTRDTEEASPEKIAAAPAASESGSPLNLCPKPVYPRTSEGSVESEMETEDKNMLHPVANQVGRTDEYNDEEDFDNDDYEYWLDEFSYLANDNGHDIGWSKEGKTCDDCHRIIRHRRWRLYPDKCGNCWRTTVKKDQKFPFDFFNSDETSDGYVKWLLGFDYE